MPNSECACDNNKCYKTHIDVVNMATTAHVTTNIMGHEKFDGSESKLDDFIKNFERYADIMGITEDRRLVMVTIFMTPSAITKFSEADGNTYKEKLKTAFVKEKSLLDTMKDILNLRWGSSDPEETFKKAEELVTILTESKLSKKKLLNLVCMNMVDDYEVKRELKLRGATETKDIKDVVSNMYELRKMEKEETVAAYNTVGKHDEWKTVGKRKPHYIERNQQRNIGNRYINQRNNEYKPRNNYSKVVKCWACHEEGHIRRNCPNIKCSYCNKNGHIRTQCYMNKNRFKERDQYARKNEWQRTNNPRNQQRHQNRRNDIAEIHDDNDYNEYEETRSNEGNSRQRMFTDNRKVYDKDQGNEDARSQGEVISVLH